MSSQATIAPEVNPREATEACKSEAALQRARRKLAEVRAAGDTVHDQEELGDDLAEARVREFYSGLGAVASGLGIGELMNVAQYVVSQDLDGAPRRVPEEGLPFVFPNTIDSSDDLHRYWRQLLKPSFGRRLELKVDSVRTVRVAPDLRLALTQLSVRKVWADATLYNSSLTGAFIGLLLPVLGRWTTPVVNVLLGMLLGVAVFGLCLWLRPAWEVLRSRVADTRRVSKLLVRQGDEWKLFCGDWEGWEERDLSWLDEQPMATANDPN